MKPFRAVMKAAPLLPSSLEHTDEHILAAMRKLRYPVLATTKLDGVRAVRLNGTLLSCSLKQIPNKSICRRGTSLPAGFDMELWRHGMTFNEIQSVVMSESHLDEDSIQFHVIDWYGEDKYDTRCIMIADEYDNGEDFKFQFPIRQHNADELMSFFLQSEINGDEGICFRIPNSPYKHGRSTLNEQYLIKLCRWLRMEVKVIGYEEQIAVGKRATALNTLGSLLVVDDKSRIFSVGSGFTEAERLRIWNNKQTYMGKTFTIKYKPCGTKDNPRHPIFVGWREKGY